MNAEQRKLKKFITEWMTCRDSEGGIVCKKDGTVEIKSSYFYRHGNTSIKHGEAVTQQLQHEQAPTGWKVVDTRDEWKSWPKTSYFIAVVRRPDD